MTRISRSQDFLLSPRFIGGVILLGVLLPVVGVIVVAAQGDLEGLTAAFRGVDEIGASASALATTTLFAIPGLILLLVGFGLFTLLLREVGGGAISVVAFSLWFAGLLLALVSSTFQASVTVWAGDEFARTGAVPELYEPLRQWMNRWMQRAWVPMGLLAVAAYGWAILETRLLPSWVGWGSIGWGLVWLLLFLPGGSGLPAVVYLAPIVIGVVLVTQRNPRSREKGTTPTA